MLSPNIKEHDPCSQQYNYNIKKLFYKTVSIKYIMILYRYKKKTKHLKGDMPYERDFKRNLVCFL